MGNQHLRLVVSTPPALVSETVRPPARKHLTPTEIEQVMEAAGRRGRHGHRDSTLILVAWRHGLRAGEAVSLRWDQVDLQGGLLHVARLKNGTPSTHPIRGPEIRALRRLKREQMPVSPYVFATERRGPLTTGAIRKLMGRLGAMVGHRLHFHQLRHGCGYKLANDGQDTRAIQHYLGHKNITHTVRYTELAPGRFKDFWKD